MLTLEVLCYIFIMTRSMTSKKKVTYNPIDLIEEVLVDMNVDYERSEPEAIQMNIEGHWGIYRMQMIWHGDFQIIHMITFFDMKVPAKTKPQFFELAVMMNERLVFGHLELFAPEDIPTYRYSVLLPDHGAMGGEFVESLLEIFSQEADRFYPALDLVLNHNKKAREALTIVTMETMGEA
jgi:hypothetical protein